MGQVPVLLSTLSHAESPWFGPCALRGWFRVLPAASVSLLCSISKCPLDVQLSHRDSVCLEPYPSLDPKPALSGHSAVLMNNSSFFQSLQLEIAESCLICLSVSFPTANRLSNHFKLVPQPVLSHSHSCWSDCHQLLLGLLPGSPPWLPRPQLPSPDWPVHLPRALPRAWRLPQPPSAAAPSATAPSHLLQTLLQPCGPFVVPRTPCTLLLSYLCWNCFPYLESFSPFQHFT